MGLFYELKPRRLGNRRADHRWVFAHYIQTPTEGVGGSWYHALLFRDEDRTRFGIKEFAELVHFKRMEQLATQVMRDPVLRQSLFSDDPELRKLWKRR